MVGSCRGSWAMAGDRRDIDGLDRLLRPRARSGLGAVPAELDERARGGGGLALPPDWLEADHRRRRGAAEVPAVHRAAGDDGAGARRACRDVRGRRHVRHRRAGLPDVAAAAADARVRPELCVPAVTKARDRRVRLPSARQQRFARPWRCLLPMPRAPREVARRGWCCWRSRACLTLGVGRLREADRRGARYRCS